MSRMRISGQHFPCPFEHGYRLTAGNSRKVVEEFGQRATGLQVVEQGLNRNASPDEDRRSAKNLGIAVNDLRFLNHDRPPSFLAMIPDFTVWILSETHRSGINPDDLAGRSGHAMW